MFARFLALMYLIAAVPVAANPIEGRWITASGNLEVEIAPCAEQPATLCGTVVRVLANRSMSNEGEPMQPVDTRPALGLAILTSLVADDGDGEPWRGDLYNREDGKTYRCELQLLDVDQLEVYAHLAIPLIGRMFGRTQVWQRATAADVSSSTRDARAPAGIEAPEFRGIEGWLNSPPLEMRNLRGKVVLVDFWTYLCSNCLNTLPHVKAWHERYAPDGLVVVGVHTPELAAERDAANVRRAVERHGITYPVALDTAYATWKAYANRFWPALYLVDRNGRIVYRHFGEGSYAETEVRIRALLAADGFEKIPG